LTLYPLLRPWLFRLAPERAHRTTLALLDLAHACGIDRLAAPDVPDLPVRIMGLEFPNPVGLAAGLDKNGEHIDALASLGFGFIEIGTVTPRPQPGNPQPRLFRLPQAQALINRLGFNNLGIDRLLHNVGRAHYRGILGINLGKNFDTPVEKAAADYIAGMRKAYPAASYLTVNISSPNTAGLRRLQEADELGPLLDALKREQAALADRHGRYVPLVVKIAPDLTAEQVVAIAQILREQRIDGVIATNTTLSRTGVEGLPHATETGGLSGAPLRERATAIVRGLHERLGDAIPIIAAGGILTAADAAEKIAAGAKLVQLYTGLIYRGPALVHQCVEGLLDLAIAGHT
jgi:dihydroorotate dehydrogenase